MPTREEKHKNGSLLSPSLFISIGALLLSAWVAYTSTLSPPDVHVSFSDPVWIHLGDLPTKEDSPGEVGLVLTCSFTNTGARNGVVEDVLLRIQSEDGSENWLFFPIFQIDASKVLLAREVPSPSPTSIVGVQLMNALSGIFYPVGVPGRSSVALTYLFKPVRDLAALKYTKLTPHTYEIAALVRMAGEDGYKRTQTISVKIVPHSIDIINSGQSLQIQSDQEHNARSYVK